MYNVVLDENLSFVVSSKLHSLQCKHPLSLDLNCFKLNTYSEEEMEFFLDLAIERKSGHKTDFEIDIALVLRKFILNVNFDRSFNENCMYCVLRLFSGVLSLRV
jgi:hypothetical protein